MKQQSRALTPAELSAFCTQLAMILKAGISLEEGVSMMLEDTQDGASREILTVLKTHVECREPLFHALQAAQVFPAYVIHMAEIGERAGRLEEVMDALAVYYDREDTLARNLRSAVAYPLVMVAMMALVIGVLVVKVLPVFQEVFLQLGAEMNGFSKGIIATGAVAAKLSAAVAAALLVLLVLLLLLRRTEQGRLALGRLAAACPISGTVFLEMFTARFASAMAMMLASGLDVSQALELAGGLVEAPAQAEKITACQTMVETGVPFSDAVVKAGIFSGVSARMVAVGFKTGSADTALQKLAGRYQEDVDARLSRIVSVLEPTLVAVLSIVVGMILLSVMLPLMGIMTSIG